VTNADSQDALAGRTILVTRARHQAGRLAEALRARGATVLEIPAIAIEAPPSYVPLDVALQDIAAYQWLIVTSANGAQALRARMDELGLAPDHFAQLQVAAVGSATAAMLREAGLRVTVTPREYVAESLVEALGDRVAGQRVLLARAMVARDVIPDALRARGATVEMVDAYRTIIPAESVTAIRTVFGPEGRVPDAATFTSSSTVTNFLALVEAAGATVPPAMKAVSIGPVTSATLREHGWEPAGEADPHDLGGLVEAVVRAVAGLRG
jgi:uroporphyrinogen-III synthase